MGTAVFLLFFASILLGGSLIPSNKVSALGSSSSEKFSTAGGRAGAGAGAGAGAASGGGGGGTGGGRGVTGSAGGSPGKGTGSSSGNDPTKGAGTIPLIVGTGAAAGATHPHRTTNAAPIAVLNPSASLVAFVFLIFVFIFPFIG